MRFPFIASLLAAWKRRRRLHETRHALQRLDPRTLRDIGIDASEIVSVAWPGIELEALAHRIVIERDLAHAPLIVALLGQAEEMAS